jgi:DNA-binding IclR family transcriptional regulator
MSRDPKPRRTPASPFEPRADFVEVLAKGLRLLEAFERDESLGNADLVALTGYPKATVSRLVGTLVSLGYLQRDAESRNYVVGARMLGFGARLQRHMRLQRAARPRMQELAEALDLTIVLGTQEGDVMLLLEVVRPPRSRLTVNTEAGSRMPIANSALGHACLIASPLRERIRTLEALRRRDLQAWETLREQVEQGYATRMRQRFVLSARSRELTLAAAACPLLLGRRAFGLSAVGPAVDLTRGRLMEVVGPAVADMADRVAVDLGGSAASAASPARISRQGPARGPGSAD